jgi:hypothetical protein
MQRAAGQLDKIKRDEINETCPTVCNDHLERRQAQWRVVCVLQRASFVIDAEQQQHPQT